MLFVLLLLPTVLDLLYLFVLYILVPSTQLLVQTSENHVKLYFCLIKNGHSKNVLNYFNYGTIVLIRRMRCVTQIFNYGAQTTIVYARRVSIEYVLNKLES